MQKLKFIIVTLTFSFFLIGTSIVKNHTRVLEKKIDKMNSKIFSKEKEQFYQKWYRKYMATFRLQQYFNRMYDNPDYVFCRKRLERMFEKTIN